MKSQLMRIGASKGVWLSMLVGLTLGCATAPPAPTGLTPQQQRIHALLEEINFPKFAERLKKVSLRVAGFPRDGELPEDQRLRTRIEAQLAPDAVVRDVVIRVSASFNEAYVAELERFDASELGRKVGDAADVPYSWFSQLGYRMFGSVSGGPPERVALVEKLDALTHSSQASTDAYMTVYAAIVRWYDTKGFINDEEAEAVGGTDALIAREHEKVDAVKAQHTIPFGLYALSDLSTAELGEYVTVAGSPASQWFAKAVREALAGSIQERAAEIAR